MGPIAAIAWVEGMVEQNLDHKSGSKTEKWVWAPIPSQSTLKELMTSWKVPHQKGSIASHRATLDPSRASVGKVSVSLPVILSGLKSCYMYTVACDLKLALQPVQSHLDGCATHLQAGHLSSGRFGLGKRWAEESLMVTLYYDKMQWLG